MPATTRLPRVARAMAVLACASLGACASGPDHVAPRVAAPAAWSSAGAGTAPVAGWWRRMGDAPMAELVADAMGGNQDVAAAVARLRQARAARVQAEAAGLPSLGGSGNGSRGNVTSLYQGGFDAGYEVDLFGGVARSVEAATYAEQGGEEALRATMLALAGEVARTYVEARGFQARIAVARRASASQASTLVIARARVSTGVGTDVDAGKAEALAASTQANLPVLEAAYAQSVHRLGVLTGRPPGALRGALARPRPVPRPGPAPRAGIPADVVRSRPDVRKAERALAEATARVGVAEAALYPSLRLGGSLSLSAATLGGLATGPAGWAFGPSLDVPILDGGARRAAVEAREGGRDEALALYRSSVLAAMEDVENAMVSLARERERFARLARAAEAYRRATTLARSLYERGAGGFLDVLDAERSLYQAEDALEQSRVLVATDHVALCKALGGGWDGAAPSLRTAREGT